MSEETFVMAFWSLLVVSGFIGGLCLMAWVSDMIQRGFRHHWPDWDWDRHAEQHRRVTDRARKTRAGIRE